MTESVCTVPLNLCEGGMPECKCTSKWFVDKAEYDPLECTYELLINGEKAFGAVYEAIRHAKSSVLIACWGFQPSMYFVRRGAAQPLVQGILHGDDTNLTIGQLLEKKAYENVKVRVLCWADRVLPTDVSLVPISDEVNTPGMGGLKLTEHLKVISDRNFGATDEQCKYDKDFFDAYVHNRLLGIANPTNWFLRTFLKGSSNAALEKAARLRENLQVYLRGFSLEDRLKALRGHDEHASILTRGLYATAPSHHQKVVLVDYDDPVNHVGFVMGHNMLDEYWDTEDHSYYRKASHTGRNGLLPRQDLSARVTGPIVGNLLFNFETAWEMRYGELPYSLVVKASTGPAGPLLGSAAETAIRRTLRVAQSSSEWPKVDFTNHRLHLMAGCDLRTYGCIAQIVRTQPQFKKPGEGQPDVQDIRQMYLQNVENALDYIYFENQYFRWQQLADVLLAHAARFGRDGRAPARHGSLYLFVVTNSSEAGMGAGALKTYKMLDSLGRADTMPTVARSHLKDDLNRNREERHKLVEAENALAMQQARDQKLSGTHPELAKTWDTLRADIAREEARQPALLEEQKRLEARKAALKQGKKDPIAPVTRPGLKIHVCTLVPPDTPPRVEAAKKAEAFDQQLASLDAKIGYLQKRIDGAGLLGYDADRAQKSAWEKELAELKRRRSSEAPKLEEQRMLANTWQAPEKGVAGDIWRWPETYIHSKLMIIDDEFITSGSTNINERSMTVDTEMNILHSNHMIATKARKDLWTLHTNGRGAQDDTPEAFKKWGEIMAENKGLEEKGESPKAPLRGFMRMNPSQTDND